jgi:hypothetical protein
LMGFAGHSCPCIARTPFGRPKSICGLRHHKTVRARPSNSYRQQQIGKLIKCSNPGPIRHKLAGCEATVKLPGLINDHRIECRKHIPRTVARRSRTKNAQRRSRCYRW